MTMLNNVLHQEDTLWDDLLVNIITYVSHKDDLPNLFIAGMAQITLRLKFVKLLHQAINMMALEKYSSMLEEAPNDLKILWNTSMAKFQNSYSVKNANCKQPKPPRVSRLCILLEYFELSKTLTTSLEGNPNQDQILWPVGASLSDKLDEDPQRPEFSALIATPAPFWNRKLVFLARNRWFNSDRRAAQGQEGLHLLRLDVGFHVSNIAESHVGLIFTFGTTANTLNRLIGSNIASFGTEIDYCLTPKELVFMLPKEGLNVPDISRKLSQSPKLSWLLNYQNDKMNVNVVPCYWSTQATEGIGCLNSSFYLMRYIKELVQHVHKHKILHKKDG